VSMMGGIQDYMYSFYGYFGGSRVQHIDYLNPGNVDYVKQSTCTLRAIFRPRLSIPSSFLGSLSPSLTVGYGNLWAQSGGGTSPRLYQSFDLGFNRNSPIGGSTTLGFGGNAGLTLSARGDTGASLRVGPTLTTNWSGGSASLNYTLNLQSGTTDGASGLSKHQVGCNLYFDIASRLSITSSADYGLDSKRLYLYSSLNYRLPKQWQIRSSYNLYQYAYDINGSPYTYTNSYLKVGIYRPIGPYEIGLAWSPNGQDYGIEKDRRFWLELGARGF
jgi:hypothetical protein